MTIEIVPAQAEPTTPTNRGTAALDGLLDPTPLVDGAIGTLTAGLLGSLLRQAHDAAAYTSTEHAGQVMRATAVSAQAFDSLRDAPVVGSRDGPKPKKIPLPLGGHALMYTRENLVWLYKCGHGELGRLLKARLAPLPIRVDGQILWYVDEALNAQAQVERTLKRWRDR